MQKENLVFFCIFSIFFLPVFGLKLYFDESKEMDETPPPNPTTGINSDVLDVTSKAGPMNWPLIAKYKYPLCIPHPTRSPFSNSWQYGMPSSANNP